jgi:hypothetical protein
MKYYFFTSTHYIPQNTPLMKLLEEMIKCKLVSPIEGNNYCVFNSELENNPLVLFHQTLKQNFDSIISNGFLSAAHLHTGEIESVSYAIRSSGCFANKGTKITEDLVVFAVEFNTLDKAEIVVNDSDIHVYNNEIQPTILRYCELPKGYIIT